MNRPGRDGTYKPPRSARPPRVYTAGCWERVNPNGFLIRRWILVSQEGHILIQETSEARLWWRVEQWLNVLENYGAGNTVA